MRRSWYLLTFLAWAVLTASLLAQQEQQKKEPAKAGDTAPQAGKSAPSDWIDPATGHRIIRLSPDTGGSCLYFHQNTYTPEGDKFIFRSKQGIMAVDITTLGKSPPKSEVVLAGATPFFVARKAREVYFTKGKVLWAVNVDTKAQREVTTAKFIPGTHSPVNCDETFAVATIDGTDPTGKTPKPEPRKIISQRERMFGDKIKAGIPLTTAEEKSAKFEETLAVKAINPPPMAFVFTNLKTGESKTVGYQYGWLNHIQFSPTDPNILLYCHEGTWHEVDRLWIIRTDGTGMRQLHKRTMDMEIDGHEFWSSDGKIVWWDNQTPRSKEFWLKGLDIYTGQRYAYSLTRDEWSGHYNVSRDGKLFCGTGGGPGSVAFAKDGQWLYAFTPQISEEMTKTRNEFSDGKQVQYGVFKSEKLVSRKLRTGFVDPNVTITPDSKWVIFADNMHGPTHVYAVEVRKAVSE
jgi:oligogalacturonide lyase